MTGWLVLLFSLCALTLAQSEFEGEICEVFAIRREGVVFLRIDTIETQKVIIPDEFVLTVDSTHTTEFIFNDQYIFSTVNDGSTDQVAIRKRVVDEATGLWIIPRPLRSQIVQGRYAIAADGSQIDVATLGLWSLRELLKERNGDNLAIQGLTDPFADRIPYTQDGQICHDAEVSENCISVADELFEVLSATASAPASEYFESLRSVDTVPVIPAGADGYDGSVQKIFVKESTQWWGSSLTTEKGRSPGEAGFRLADDEVEDVFWLEAKEQTSHEVSPGVSISIFGWRGGKVEDFVLVDGRLTNGHIVVGPHPASDPWDVVYYGAKKFGAEGNVKATSAKRDVLADNSPFSDLEVTSPGPALTFGYGRKTRVYVQNSITGAGGIQFSWIGMQVPHDQDGSSWPATASTQTRVFEFQVGVQGTKIYVDTHESDRTYHGLFGGVLASYPSDVTQSWDRRYAHAFFEWADGTTTMNGESFPGTARRLGGWYRDRINIISSYPAADGSGDTIIEIADEPRAPVAEGSVKHECPAYGGPIVGRPGTGCLSAQYGHIHKGHQIVSRTFSPGTWVTISGHSDRSDSGVEYTINGERLAIREGDSPNLLRIQKVGAGTNGGVGGELSIWRLHKADYEKNPTWQNSGFGGSYMRFNYGEEVAISYMNAGSGAYPVHLQGHRFSVFAVDGEVLASPLTRSTFPLHEGSTFDIVVSATNPNHDGAWLHFAWNPEHFVAPYDPVWIDGSKVPAGAISYVDYTGFYQQKLVIDQNGAVQPFQSIPPKCDAESNLINNVAYRDVLNWEASAEQELIYLTGKVVIPYDRYLERDIVTVGDNDWSWTVVSRPTGAAMPIIENVVDMPFVSQVRGFTAAGNYTFRFMTNGKNVESADPAKWSVPCWKEITITISPVVLNDMDRVRTHYWGEPLNVRLGGNADRGHITFPLFNAHMSTTPDYLDLTIAVTSSNPPTPSPFDDFNTGVRFFSWPVQNSISHIWYAETEYTGATTTARDTAAYTFGRLSLDSRISLYNDMAYSRGGPLAAEIPVPPSATDASVIPDHVEILLPMWQGRATVGGTDRDVYFLITESSDETFCEYYGCTYAPALLSVSTEAVNDDANAYSGQRNTDLLGANRPAHVRVRATTFKFAQVPNNIPYGGDDVDTFYPGYAHQETFDKAAEVASPYSPLKRFLWTPPGSGTITRTVIANMPFVYWADEEVQAVARPASTNQQVADAIQLVADTVEERLPTYTGGCSSLYRAAHPSQWWYNSGDYEWDTTSFDNVGPYIARGLSCSTADTLKIHTGGQLTRQPNFEYMTVAFKAHLAHSTSDKRFPFYILTDSSDLATSQIHGIHYAAKLSALGAATDNFDGVASLRVPVNGFVGTTGGPAAIHPAIVSITPDTPQGYTPLTHVTNLFWNCGNYDVPYGPLSQTSQYQTLVFKNVIDAEQASPYWQKRNAYVGVKVEEIEPSFKDFYSADTTGWTRLFNPAPSPLPTEFVATVKASDFGATPFWRVQGQPGNIAKVSINGLISLWDSDAPGAKDGCPSVATAACSGQLLPAAQTWDQGLIVGFWGGAVRDFVGNANVGRIRFKAFGDDGSRIFVFHWDDVQLLPVGAGGVNRPVNYQIRLFENKPNVVEVHYKLATHPNPNPSLSTVAANANYFSAGVQGPDGRSFANFFFENDHLTKPDPEMIKNILTEGTRQWYQSNYQRDIDQYLNSQPDTLTRATSATVSAVTIAPWTVAGVTDPNAFRISVTAAAATFDFTGAGTSLAAEVKKAIEHVSFYTLTPGYTAYLDNASVSGTSLVWKVTLFEQVAVRYTLPAADLPSLDPSEDIAQLIANLNKAECPTFVKDHLSGSTYLWANTVDSLLWSGALIETEAPAGSWIRGPDASLDHQPVVWNTPQLFSFDLSQTFDAENTLLLNINGVQSSGYLPGDWVAVWNHGNLSPDPAATPSLGNPSPINNNLPSPARSIYTNPYAVIASLPADVSTNNKNSYWARDPVSTPAVPCPPCPANGICSPCWSTNYEVYPDLHTLAVPTDLNLLITPLPARPDTWFTILESSDALFSSVTGAKFVPSLATIPWSAVDSDVQFPRWFNEFADLEAGQYNIVDGLFTFSETPGKVGNNQGRGPLTNPWYSPIKRFTYNGRIVTMNAPSVWWGAGEGESMIWGRSSTISYTAPCSTDIRRNVPSSIWLNNGPLGCNHTGVESQALSPLEFHNGGQVLQWATTPSSFYVGRPSVTVKLHAGQGKDPQHVPYYTVWDASDYSIAGFMGVPFSVRLANLKKAGPGVATVRTFANGDFNFAGGPNMFEASLFSQYPDSYAYTAFSRLTSVFYNCNDRVVPTTSFYRYGANIAVGDVPVEGSGIPGFDPLQPNTFDPYQVRRSLKGFQCSEWLAYTWTEFPAVEGKWKGIDVLLSKNKAFESETPAGIPQDSFTKQFTIANMPQHLYLDERQDYSLRTDTTEGNAYRFWAVDEGLTWFYTVNNGPVRAVYECHQQGVFDCTVEDNNGGAGNKQTITVKPGDRVEIWVHSTHTAHGLVWWLNDATDAITGVEAYHLKNFFAIDSDYVASKVVTPVLQPTWDGYWYGSAATHTGSVKLFGGVVKASALGEDWWAYANVDTPANKRAEEAVPTGTVRANRQTVSFFDPAFGPAMRVNLFAFGKAVDNE